MDSSPPRTESPRRAKGERVTCTSLFCDTTFGRPADRNKHKKLKHANDTDCTVAGCGITMEPKYLDGHLAEHRHFDQVEQWNRFHQPNVDNMLVNQNKPAGFPAPLQNYNVTPTMYGGYMAAQDNYLHGDTRHTFPIQNSSFGAVKHHNQQPLSLVVSQSYTASPLSTMQHPPQYSTASPSSASSYYTPRSTHGTYTDNPAMSNPRPQDDFQTQVPVGLNQHVDQDQATNSAPTTFTDMLNDENPWDPSQIDM